VPAASEAFTDLPLRTFDTGETVLAEGHRSGMLYVLASGRVEVLKEGVQINVIGERGAFFGEVSVLLDEPHTATVRALEPTTFHVVDEPLVFLRSRPVLALEVARLLARRVHYLTTYLVDVKRQFADSGGHLGIVDEILESLAHHQEPEVSAGSDRCPEPDPTKE
jgi:CRP-like cAMP-binding protein